MTCVKCNKDMIECRCPDAAQRLKWLLSRESPVVFRAADWLRLRLRLRELETEQEIKR